MSEYRHDTLTVAAIATLAFVVADLSHEGFGHAVAAHLSGAKQIVLSYTYTSSDIKSRWISGAGPLINLIEGLLALLLLRLIRMPSQVTYFLFLLFLYNMLDASAYLVYSGVSNFGDLSVVIAGLQNLSAIRVGMVAAGILTYGLITYLGGHELRRFKNPHELLTSTAYIAAVVVDTGAAILNPLGLKYYLISALPTTLGANAGMLFMPSIAKDGMTSPHLIVTRSYPWMIAGLAMALLFIVVVGPGLVLSR